MLWEGKTMLTEWITDRRIVCLTHDGENVLVFRQHNADPEHLPRHRYVLGNGKPVIVDADSSFRVLGSDVPLSPTAMV
jgi:hypothetical protein